MDLKEAHAFADAFWEEKILPALSEYIRIPVLSRAFDPGWETNGHTDRARVGESEILGDQESLCRLDGRPQVVILRALQALAYDSVDVMT